MRIPGWLLVIGIVVIFVLTGLLSVVSYSVARQFAIDLGNSVSADRISSFGTSVLPTPTPVTVASAPTRSASQPLQANPLAVTSAPAATLDPAAQYVWADPRRFNLLLLGIDQRSGVDEPGPYRTDTMIVVSVDPLRKTAGMLWIPRDLWVNIPGYAQGRINTANAIGEAQSYPGGGPALAAETVRQVLGIPIDKYILINFSVFTTAVNTVAPEGVEICVSEAIDDPNYPDAGYGFIHVQFAAGCQIMNAEQLLQYARTRHGNSDFERSVRQQVVLTALREKLLSLGGVGNFIGQAPALWEQLTGNFKTNMTLEEILQLGTLVSDIPGDHIRYGFIDNLYVRLAKTTSGDDVLILQTNAVRLLLQQVFSADDTLSLSELRTKAEAENASIVVFNNTDTPGLAGQTRDWLSGRGVTVEGIGDTPESTGEETVIQVYTGKIWTGKYLAALMGIPPERVRPGADGLTTNDIAILVGNDIQSILSQ
jgi:LCP family protein required for cell wall assembly